MCNENWSIAFHYIEKTFFNVIDDPLCLILAVWRTFIAFLVLSIAFFTFSSKAHFLIKISAILWFVFGLNSVSLRQIKSVSGFHSFRPEIGRVNLLWNYLFFEFEDFSGDLVPILVMCFKSLLNCYTVFKPLIYCSWL